MIELFTHGTPNGHKINIALEEMQLSYEMHVADIFAGGSMIGISEDKSGGKNTGHS